MTDLIITRISMENWKSHSASELFFSRGTNVLVGIMGSGKSSLLSAVSFALFGETPETRSRRAKLDDLILSRPGQAKSAAVSLDFSFSGKSYSVGRRIERGAGSVSAELREKAGRLVEGPQPAKVTDAICKILELNYDLFMQAVFSEQNQLDSFLAAPKGRRREKLDDFFGVTAIEDARKTLLLISASFEKETEILSREGLEEAAKSAAASLESERAQAARLGEELVAKAHELSKATSAEAAARQDLEKLEALRSSAERLSVEEGVRRKRIRELEARLSEYKAVGDAGAEKRLAGLLSEVCEVGPLAASLSVSLGRKSSLAQMASQTEAQLSKLAGAPPIAEAERSLREAERHVSDLKGRVQVARSEGKELSRKAGMLRAKEASLAAGIDGELSRAEGELAAASKRQDALDAEKRLEEDALAILSRGRDACPVCGSALGHDRVCKMRDDKALKVSKLSAQLLAASSERRALDARVVILRQKSRSNAVLASEISALRNDLSSQDRKEAELASLEKNLSEASEGKAAREKEFLSSREAARLSSEAKALTRSVLAEDARAAEIRKTLNGRTPESVSAAVDEARALAESFRISRDLLAEKSSQEECARSLADVSSKFSAEALARAKAAHSALLSSKAELLFSASSIPAALSERRSRAAQLEKELSEVSGRLARKSRVQGALDFSRSLDRALRATEERLRSELMGAVNAQLSSFWSSLYPYEDFTALRLFPDEQDYLLQLRSPAGDWEDVDKIASGGERSIACLALRIAFAKVLAPRLRLLILDEPTHNLDASAVSELASVLRERMAGVLEQVILITHEEDLEAAATGNCYSLERSKAGESTVARLVSGGGD